MLLRVAARHPRISGVALLLRVAARHSRIGGVAWITATVGVARIDRASVLVELGHGRGVLPQQAPEHGRRRLVAKLLSDQVGQLAGKAHRLTRRIHIALIDLGGVFHGRNEGPPGHLRVAHEHRLKLTIVPALGCRRVGFVHLQGVLPPLRVGLGRPRDGESAKQQQSA